MHDDNDGHCHIIRTLSRLLFDGYYIFYWSCWCVIRLTRKAEIPIPILNDWLTDLVFVPIVAHSTTVLYVILFGIKTPALPLWQLLILAFYTSVVFEWLAPIYTTYNVSDWKDVVAYFSGAVFYFFVHQKHTLMRKAELFARKNHA